MLSFGQIPAAEVFARSSDDQTGPVHLRDLGLLSGKIVVGAVITLVPLLILAGGLWAIQKLLAH
jgi:hypothetical protein